MAGGEVGELGIVGEKVMQPVLDVEAVRDAAPEDPDPLGRKRPPCVATPTSAVVGLKRSASSTLATTGTPSSSSPG